jgi:hypothetical protein
LFVLGRVKSSPAAIEAKSGAFAGSLRTAAPGVVLAVLGVALMVATLFVPYEISVSDSAVYLPVVAPSRLQETPAPKPPSINFP